MPKILDFDVACPSCASQRTWRDGSRYTKGAQVQRYLCRGCGYRFSLPHTKILNSYSRRNATRQCMRHPDKGTKNMAKVEPQIETLAGGTRPDKTEVKGKIIEFLMFLKRENYAKLTIQTYVKEMVLLAKRGANLSNPESVKTIIANQPWCDNRKTRVYWVYDLFLRMQGRSWVMPRHEGNTKSVSVQPKKH